MNRIKVSDSYPPTADPRVVLDMTGHDDTLDVDRNGVRFTFSIIDDSTGHTISVAGLDGARRLVDSLHHKMGVARAMQADLDAEAAARSENEPRR